MNIYFPDNIFTRLIKESLPGNISKKITFVPASLISNEIAKNKNSAGLIPTLDLIKQRDFFVSRSFGISFEETLCNSYFYFQGAGKDIKELSLLGDVSSNEVIGAKLLLKEIYSAEVELSLLTDEKKAGDKNILVVGYKNFENDKFRSGISFAEEIIEILSLPYVNFVLASTESTVIQELHHSFKDVQTKIYNFVESGNFGEKLSDEFKSDFQKNIASFICNLDEQDLDGIDQLIRLPFYHELIQDIIEVKYI